MHTSRTHYLVDDLNRSFQSFDFQNNPQDLLRSTTSTFLPCKQFLKTKTSKEKLQAKRKYEYLTNMTKQQQNRIVWQQMQKNKKLNKKWSYQYYTGNNKLNDSKNFNVIEKKQMQSYIDSNQKYNIQFLGRSLHGKSNCLFKEDLKFSLKQQKQLKKPSHNLYSKHYKPIVKQKLKFNQDWQLSASQYGKIWVDHKKDRIIDNYNIQACPFRTPRSNSLLSQMRRSKFIRQSYQRK